MQKTDCHIYNMLKTRGARLACTDFHMPGHKGHWRFLRRFPVGKMDVTELPDTDNLFAPEGVIAKAQADIAQILGARASYITTDGSTSGVYTLLFVASRKGSKVIVPRNAHASVYNGCRLLNLEPVIVQGEEKEGVLLPPDPALVERLLVNDASIGGVLVTSPDYYGNVAPLAAYKKITQKYNRLLLVDGAHGAHLAFSPERAGYCGNFADAWVDGAHKTLPALTQGAIVNVARDDLLPFVEEGLSLFRTTSPSYPVMASVEYGVKFMHNHRDDVVAFCQKLQDFYAELGGFTFYPSQDWAKIAVDFKPLGVDPALAVKALERRKIYVELCDGRYLLLYLSIFTNEYRLREVASVLLSVVSKRKNANTYQETRFAIPRNARTYSYLYALKQPSELVLLAQAEGRMCAQNAGVSPPCTPVVVAGEMITKEVIAALGAKNTFGLYENGSKIKVVKK